MAVIEELGTVSYELWCCVFTCLLLDCLNIVFLGKTFYPGGGGELPYKSDGGDRRTF